MATPFASGDTSASEEETPKRPSMFKVIVILGGILVLFIFLANFYYEYSREIADGEEDDRDYTRDLLGAVTAAAVVLSAFML